MTSKVEKAKEFWRDVDVDSVFDALDDYLQHLREMIEAERATDRELILGMNVILASELCVNAKSESASIEDTRISTEILAFDETEGNTADQDLEEESVCEQELKVMLSRCDSGCRKSHPSSPEAPLPTPKLKRDCLIAPLSLLAPAFQFHACSRTCLSRRLFSAHHMNPLKVPLMWGFQRLHGQGAGPGGKGAGPGWHAIVYKAPCGRSLRGAAEVLRYLHETEADALLHPGNFSFSTSVLLRELPLSPGGARELLDPDLSKGAEPVPVQLWNAVDGEWPEKFRYRTHTQPRSCLPGSGPVYSACCDCTDGCADKRKCSCLRLSLRAAHPSQLYSYRRLPRPTPTGIYECGPWCGCDRARCQNRIVQHGVQVRLQVFRTQDQGWGVRCLDDLDRGTFICTYTGVVLCAELGSGEASLDAVPSDPSPMKRKREEQSSDDEVELVEEWRLPAGETDSPPNTAPPSPPAHVSVIRTPTGLVASELDSERAEEEPQPAMSPSSETPSPHWLLPQTQKGNTHQKHTDSEIGEFEGNEVETGPKSRRVAEQEGRAWRGPGGDTDEGACHSGTDEEHLYYLDATEEGNVGRFLNHSCCPNLFVQNVFIDSHHRDFPTVAFFTSRPVTAGTELTWNYLYDPGSAPEQEVPCQCGYESCQGALI